MPYPTEELEQVTLINYIRKKYKKLIIFSIPNGATLKGNTHQRARQMNSLKASGLLVGTPDLCLLLPNGKSVFIEMKRQKGGVLSKNQKDFIKKADSLNHNVIVGYGYKDALIKLEKYLSNI